MSQPTAEEIRAAAAFLKKKQLTPPLSPARVAATAKEQGIGFSAVVKFIMNLYRGQQNAEQQTHEVLQDAARSGK